MLAISEIIIASAIFLGIVYWEVKFLYTKTTVGKINSAESERLYLEMKEAWL